MTAKTSPYIYPFQPFLHLDKPTPTSRFAEAREMTETEFSAWLETFAPKIHPLEGQETAEAIYSVFADPGVVFGDPAFLSSRREEWLQRFGRVVAEGRRLDLTILGFPYKMPVPLKTDRTAADFGEVVSLARLNQLARAIGRVYAPGARIHVFTEGAFHVFNSLNRSYADGYFASLQALASRFGVNEHVELHDLNAVVDDNPDFMAVWRDTEADLIARRDAGDEKVLAAIRDSLPVRFHNLANPGVGEADLAAAYRRDPAAKALIDDIQQRAERGTVTYRAFLEARDRISLLQRIVPDALPMTVSPRPGRLGVRPLPEPSRMLPYHGVSVISADGATLEMQYLWDLRRTGRAYVPLHLVGDADPAPFAYLEA